MHIVICLLFALTPSDTSSAARGAGKADVNIETAKRLYFEAVEGKSESLERATEILRSRYEQDRSNVVVKAYLGSSLLLESAKTLAVWRKGKLAKEGLELLDAAVAGAPDHPEVRFIRAASTYHLPRWFGRRKECEQDFALLSKPEYRRDLDARLAAAVMYFQGVLEHRAGHKDSARASWREAVRLAPESRAGRDAAARLAVR